MPQSLRAAPEFTALAQHLRELSNGRQFAYFQIAGNWGDALIRKGAVNFFEKEGFSPRFCYARDRERQRYTFKRFPPRKKWVIDHEAIDRFAHGLDLAVISGGGSWSPSYSGTRGLAITLLRYFSKVVVMPHSFALPPVTGDVTYYCRDREESLQSVGSAQFCHDMAFYVEPTRRDPMMDVGYYFRGDRESKYKLNRVPENVDVSRLGNELADPDGLFNIVGRYDRVVTDRLHVAIAGALLGRTTYALGGSYWKMRSVFDASLRPNFPNAHFCASPSDLPADINDRLAPWL